MDRLKRQRILHFIAWLASGCMTMPALAAVTPGEVNAIRNALVPSTTQPGQISNYLANPLPSITRTPAHITSPNEQKTSLGPQAEKIKFKLEKVILEGNCVYSDEQLSKIYQQQINTTITVAELQDIVQSITNYYRNNGYILSRAILPPQHIEHGIVHIRVIEGYIDQVHVIGNPKGAKNILMTYGNQIAQSKPVQIKVMEHYLRVANEVPGLSAKAVLEPAKNQVGASDLNLDAQEKTFNFSYSYDDYGTLYLGPLQNTFNASANSLIRSGDSIRGTFVRTSIAKELQFYDLSYLTPFGVNGWTVAAGKNYSATQPGLNLVPLGIQGAATTYYILSQYPLLRSRAQNITLDGGFNYIDADVNSTPFGLGTFQLYMDHIRSIKFGGNWDFADRFSGSNLLGLHAEQGLNIFGASNDPNSFTVSRFGADGIFTKVVAQVIHLQPLFHSRYSLYFLANGQYSFNPLLSTEQFGFGGSQLGRGYDPAEIIGDRGAGGTLELRGDFAPGWRMLNALEPYLFYDQGIIWNIRHFASTIQEQSAASTGVGVRLYFMKNLSGNVMISQPLTRQIAAEQVVGRGKQPRTQFSIVAML